jgi:uncharacterized protein (TIGR00297 family)
MSKLRLLLGFLFSASISFFAYRKKSLSRSGLAGATITGTTIVGSGGWPWGLSLIFFFVSSSLLSHFRAQKKEQTAADKFSKGSQRDIAQVAANGGLATALALAYGIHTARATQSNAPVSLDVAPDLLDAALQAGFVGALATANADTWATELGVLSAVPPRLITTGAVTAPGTSGGITPLGMAASAAGALAQGLAFWLLQRGRARECATQKALPAIALVSGLAGSVVDSWLGATVQAMYYCPTCKKETERRVHSCGTHTRPLRGLPWMNNDAVNFLATLCGAGVAAALAIPFRRRKA